MKIICKNGSLILKRLTGYYSVMLCTLFVLCYCFILTSVLPDYILLLMAYHGQAMVKQLRDLVIKSLKHRGTILVLVPNVLFSTKQNRKKDFYTLCEVIISAQAR